MSGGKEQKIAKPYIIFTIILFLSLIFPVYGIANSVMPLVLRLPFGLFWIALVEVVAFLGLCIFYLIERRQEDGTHE